MGRQRCVYEGCEEKGTDLAQGRGDGPDRHPNVGLYCPMHARIVAGEDNPEYVVSCPHCGCDFGVN